MVTKKEKEAFEIINLNDQIKSEKRQFQMYVDTIKEYAFTNICTGAVYFGDLYHKELFDGFDAIRNSKLTKEQKDMLQGQILFWSDGRPTKIESLEQDLDYYKKLNSWAKTKLNGLPDEIKEKIIKASIRGCEAWSNQFNTTSKIGKQITELEKHNKVIKKNYPKKAKKNGTKRNSKKTKKDSGRK